MKFVEVNGGELFIFDMVLYVDFVVLDVVKVFDLVFVFCLFNIFDFEVIFWIVEFL